jgi:hypothetical protein
MQWLVDDATRLTVRDDRLNSRRIADTPQEGGRAKRTQTSWQTVPGRLQEADQKQWSRALPNSRSRVVHEIGTTKKLKTIDPRRITMNSLSIKKWPPWLYLCWQPCILPTMEDAAGVDIEGISRLIDETPEDLPG